MHRLGSVLASLEVSSIDSHLYITLNRAGERVTCRGYNLITLIWLNLNIHRGVRGGFKMIAFFIVCVTMKPLKTGIATFRPSVLDCLSSTKTGCSRLSDLDRRHPHFRNFN